MKKYVIEDEFHCGLHGEFETFDDALNELKRKADLGWEVDENKCPCASWKTCSMYYKIIEYDTNNKPYWKNLSSQDIVEISSKGIEWFYIK